MVKCSECGSEMRRTSKINSSNSIIETWTCTDCGNTKEICTGLIN